jgi:hypothetical protein
MTPHAEDRSSKKAASGDELEAKIEAILQRTLKQKFLFWGKVAGAVVAILTIVRLTVPQVLLLALGAILGGPIDESIHRALDTRIGEKVSYSYSNQFQLELPGSPYHKVPFYFDKQDSAELIVDVRHSGAAGRSPMSFILDETGTRESLGDSDRDGRRFILNELLRQSGSVERPTIENLHSLTFRLDGNNQQTNDRVQVTCVINVCGPELRVK